MTRHLLRKENSDPWAFSLYFSMVGALVSLPFMIAHVKVPTTPVPWIMILVVGVLIVIQNFLFFSSSKYIPPSVSGSITKFRLIWVMLLGIIILQESSSALKIIGTLLTVVSGIVLTKQVSKSKDVKGILYALSATIFYAIVIILYKYLFIYFNPQSLTFFIFFIPMIINFCTMRRSIRRIKVLAQNHLGLVVLTCVFGGLANLAMNQGLLLGETSRVLGIIESFLVLTLIGEHFFLKEKDNLLVKIFAVISASVGAVLMRVG